MPKELGAQSNGGNKKVVVITRPYISPDPAGLKCERYCQQSLMEHRSFRQVSELLAGNETYSEAWAEFLHSENIPSSLEEDIFRLQQYQQQQNTVSDEVSHVCINLHATV